MTTLTYISKYTNSRLSQPHLLDHSTGIPHICSNLAAYILQWDDKERVKQPAYDTESSLPITKNPY